MQTTRQGEKSGLRESDLYPALKAFLESQGYEVKGEIGDCDVVARRGQEGPVVVELKLSLNLGVVLQAIERIGVADTVYVGVPRSCSALRTQRKPILKLFRMLGVGLLAIDPRARVGAVDVLLDPGEYRPRKVKRKQERMLREFALRVGDPNAGGLDRRQGLLTAYRQRSLQLARAIERAGPMKASRLAKELGEPKAREILYGNVYGWFEREGKGVYRLSPKGAEQIQGWPEVGPPVANTAPGQPKARPRAERGKE